MPPRPGWTSAAGQPVPLAQQVVDAACSVLLLKVREPPGLAVEVAAGAGEPRVGQGQAHRAAVDGGRGEVALEADARMPGQEADDRLSVDVVGARAVLDVEP